MITDKKNFLKWLRGAAPYIREHSGKTFVIQIDGDLIASDHFQGFVHDIALLNTLGIRVVVVFGVRAQVEKLLDERGIKSVYHHNLRVTDKAALECFKEAVGSVRFEIEAKLSMGLPNSPMAHSDITVSSGNFVTARPMGVIDGTDMQFTGSLRKVDADAIRSRLANGDVVLLSPLATSVTGEVFNLSALSVATQTAIELKADKLILSFKYDGIEGPDGQVLHQLTDSEADVLLQTAADADLVPWTQLAGAVRACKSSVQRVHLIDDRDDSSLLIELFTRDGIGTLISHTRFDAVRRAGHDDIAGIMELIEPLVTAGKLVQRSVADLERDIGDFTVLDRDGAVIACVATHVYAGENIAEMACMVVHPDYQNQGKGQLLYQQVENALKKQGVSKVFLLTTQANHWFIEQGFVEAKIDDLPLARQDLYNYQRNSKVLLKKLD